MKLSAEFADELIRSFDSVEADNPGKFLQLAEVESLCRNLQNRIPDDLSMKDVLEELIQRDWVENDGNGALLASNGFRITAKGQIRAAASSDYAEQYRRTINSLPIAPDDDGTHSTSGLSSAVHNVTQESTATEPSVTFRSKYVDSTKWTGARLVLTDQKVLSEIRRLSSELREKVHDIRIESNSDSQDIKGLADALVAVCGMAEPDLSIIDQILAHPKFRMTASLIAAVATIRGALGI